MKKLSDCIEAYKKLLLEGEIQYAYSELVKLTYSLKGLFNKNLKESYSVGNVLQGYMDYTYFYVTNDFLKKKKLKLGLVLNHNYANFEIWLLGQTKEVQREYWMLLKNTPWALSHEMHQYYIVSASLLEHPDFDDLDKLREQILRCFEVESSKILKYLKKI